MPAYHIHQGNNIDILKTLEDESIDSVVTDPPYGIEFLAKDWDSNTGAQETWQECLRVLKPGGYLLAFSAARTYHQLATNIESVGFEIRDQIMWLYASGFPKALDIGKAIQKRQGVTKTTQKEMIMQGGFDNWVDTQEEKNAKRNNQTIQEVVPTSPEAKQWAGWKTALKPSHEPIVMARKPFKGSTMDNVMKHGVGALNIDASRVPWGKDDNPEAYVEWMKKYPNSTGSKAVFNNAHADAKGVVYVKDKDAEINKDRNVDNRLQGRFPSNVIGEVAEGYQKYFYCPKVSRRERHVGFEQTEVMTNPQMVEAMGGSYVDENGNPRKNDGDEGNHVWLPHCGTIKRHAIKHHYQEWLSQQDPLAHIPTNPEDSNKYKSQGNNHPTVKPVALMKYLIKLVTPPSSTVLDPFTGSGSTGMAAVELGHRFIGCELDENYVEIAHKRIQGWNRPRNDQFGELFDEG